jgi:hypothetical protein
VKRFILSLLNALWFFSPVIILLLACSSYLSINEKPGQEKNVPVMEEKAKSNNSKGELENSFPYPALFF